MGYKLTGDQLKTALKRLGEIGRQFGQAEYPYDPERLLLALQDVIEGRFVAADAGDTYPVVVDYSKSFAEMVEDGKYDSRDEYGVTGKHFPMTGSGKAKIALHLVHLNYLATSSGEVIAEMDKRGLRSATLPELLAFGAKYPDMQRQFPIAILGPALWMYPFSGDRYIAELNEYNGRRDLSLSVYGLDWCYRYRFLAVSK